jgi:glycosyltransferase involved in cell wall biosynthesis
LAQPQAAGVCAVIGGDGEERGRLEHMISSLGLQGRVTLAGALSEGPLLQHLARCRAVCFPPLQEDYGFVTAEAFAARKPLVTCHDSGGPTELVRDGVNGFVCDPTPAALAMALRKLMDDRALAERMGAAAADTAARMTWSDAVSQLTAL